MLKTICDWCGDDCEIETGHYFISLCKVVHNVGKVDEIKNEDLCEFCANHLRYVRETRKATKDVAV